MTRRSMTERKEGDAHMTHSGRTTALDARGSDADLRTARGGGGLFRDRSLRYKVGLLPALASGGFVIVLLLTVVLGHRSQERLRLVESGYYPALEMSRDLETSLSAMQRGLQDAAASRSAKDLEHTDALRDGFLQRLAREKANPVLDAREVAALEAGLRDYYALARQTTRRLIDNEGGADVTEALRAMTGKYNAVRELLA